MDENERLARRFEDERARLRAVAYRMLGSLAEADDAVQDAWVRLNQSDAERIENLGGWLTTVVARVCLNMLRARRTRREDGFGVRLPDPIIAPDDGDDGDPEPERQALLADSVSLALLIVLDALTPAERLAFVLHDLFDLPFDEIAPMVERTPAAARQLASRARRRVRGAVPEPDPDRARQRRVVDAFFAATRDGDFDALVRLLHPDVVLHADLGPGRPAAVIRGVGPVLKMARAPRGATVYPALVNGTPGAVITLHGEPFSVMAFTIVDEVIVEIDGIADPDRVRRIATGVLGED